MVKHCNCNTPGPWFPDLVLYTCPGESPLWTLWWGPVWNSALVRQPAPLTWSGPVVVLCQQQCYISHTLDESMNSPSFTYFTNFYQPPPPNLTYYYRTLQILAFDTILPPHSFIIKSKFLPLFFFSTITILILYVYQKYL